MVGNLRESPKSCSIASVSKLARASLTSSPRAPCAAGVFYNISVDKQQQQQQRGGNYDIRKPSMTAMFICMRWCSRSSPRRIFRLLFLTFSLFSSPPKPIDMIRFGRFGAG